MTATSSRIDERRTELLALLGEQAEKLTTGEGWQHWLDIARRMHGYSLNNQLLILAQRPDATYVMGYRAWQTIGRQVNSGEHGVGILAPVIKRVADADRKPDEPDRRVVAFKPTFVFDVAQTSGPDLPSTELPAVRVPDESLRDELVRSARSAGYTVEFVPTRGDDVRGWFKCQDNTISLVEDYPTSSQVRTLLHELAHAADPMIRKSYVRAERELVAESAAYLVATALGVDTADASAVYAAHWGGDRARLLALAGEVLVIARVIEVVIGGPSVQGTSM